MQLTTTQNIQAPASYVFQRATDFALFERRALRKGAEITRTDGRGPITVGAAWDVTYPFKGKVQAFRVSVSELRAPHVLAIGGESGALSGTFAVALTEVSADACRAEITLTVAPRSLQGRILVQSLKIARSTLERRFRDRIRRQLDAVEADYRKLT